VVRWDSVRYRDVVMVEPGGFAGKWHDYVGQSWIEVDICETWRNSGS
jgi:hypothetical protein